MRVCRGHGCLGREYVSHTLSRHIFALLRHLERQLSQKQDIHLAGESTLHQTWGVIYLWSSTIDETW